MAHLPHLHASCSAAALLGEPLPAIWDDTGQGQRQPYRSEFPQGLPARVEEDKAGLAGSELLDGSGRPDPASLDTGHRSVIRPTAPRGIALSWLLGSPLTASTGRFGLSPPLHFLNRPDRVNRLFPKSCVNRWSFPRAFTTHTVRAFTTLFPSILRAFTTHLHIVRTSSKEQVVRATEPVEKNQTGIQPASLGEKIGLMEEGRRHRGRDRRREVRSERLGTEAPGSSLKPPWTKSLKPRTEACRTCGVGHSRTAQIRAEMDSMLSLLLEEPSG